MLRTAEQQSFIPLLQELNEAMLAETDAQYQALQGTPWEEAARHAVAFIGVGSKLLDPQTAVPAYVQDLVEAELALIEAAGGIEPSPLFPGLENGEDYTQYIPRGHYTRSEELEAYFKSMMWYGRMTFRLKTTGPRSWPGGNARRPAAGARPAKAPRSMANRRCRRLARPLQSDRLHGRAQR